jgi:hypothetical protein
MANRNLGNSKKVSHLVGANPHAISTKSAPGSCKSDGSGDRKQVFAIFFAL